MEEMKQQLYELQNLTYQFDYINGLMYTLREALRNNDELMSFQYTMASAYISNLIMEFEENLDTLMEGMFRSFHSISEEMNALCKN